MVNKPETEPADLVALLPGFSVDGLRAAVHGSKLHGLSTTEGVIAYLTPLVRQLVIASEQSSRGSGQFGCNFCGCNGMVNPEVA